ncbi:MAG: hypothetical protein AB1815_03430 [Bacillota bacterium]
MSQQNPYILFLILILLLLGTDSKAEQKLNTLRNLIDQTAKSLSIFHDGVKTMESGMDQVRVMFSGDSTA